MKTESVPMIQIQPIRSALFVLALSLSAVSCAQVDHKGNHRAVAHSAPEDAQAPLRFLPLPSLQELDGLLSAAEQAPVIYLGESHRSYGDHLLQLAVLRGLYQQNHQLIIGMEAFQRPFQGALDAYIGGEIDEAEMLRRTEWYSRWSFGYRLYRPILRFARENRIPVIALNLPREITGAVAREGREALTPEQQAMLPDEIDRSDQAYETRLRSIFAQHPHREGQQFERFREVQLLWDEGMAETAARALRDHPNSRLAVIAGSGHLMFRSGIPNRLDRRIQDRGLLVLPADHLVLEPEAADYLAFAPEATLPPAGSLGVMLEQDETGVRVEKILETGAAANSELHQDDRILAIGDTRITSYGDVKIALLDTRPGQTVPIKIRRDRLLMGETELNIDFVLGGPLALSMK